METYIYYGEYILSFAVSTESVEMLDAAMAAGADVNAQDTLGNTAMHVVLGIIVNTIPARFLPTVPNLAVISPHTSP